MHISKCDAPIPRSFKDFSKSKIVCFSSLGKKKTSILLGLVAKHEVQPSIEKSNLAVALLVALKVVLPAQRKRFQKETDCKTNLSNPKSTSDVKF